MPQLFEASAGKVTIRQECSKLTRGLMAVAACIPLLAPYELLYKPGWPRVSSMDWQSVPFLLFFLFLALAPLTLTMALLTAAIFSPNETFTFDHYKKRFIYHASRRPWRRAVSLEVDFGELPEIQIEKRGNTVNASPDDYVLTLQLNGHKKMDIASYTGEQTAKDMRAKLLGN